MAVSKCRHVAMSINISLVYISLGLLISLQPPFYPSEAEKIGATPAQYGFVFGIANLSLFLFSPLFGKYGGRLGPKMCFTIGSILQGVSGFLFGFLPYFKDVGSFIGLSYLLRFLEGLGTAMSWSAALGMLMKIFPNKVARIMSWTQTCFGLGYMLGPAVGAALYEAGGFMLPFFSIGGLSTVLSIAVVFSIPNLDTISSSNRSSSDDEESETLVNEESGHDVQNGHSDSQCPTIRPNLRMRTIVSSPALLFPFVDLFSALCGNGMLESMLEPHLRFAGASTIDVGVSFLVFGCCYSIGNMLFGSAIDKVGYPTCFSLAGNLMFLITFSFVGPVSFIPIEPAEHLIQGMMALAGFAYSALVCSSFSRAQSKVIAMGFADDINTYVMISGIWLSAFALGNFVGPTVAGLAVDVIGFRDTTIIFFALYAAMSLIDAVESVKQVARQRAASAYEEIG